MKVGKLNALKLAACIILSEVAGIIGSVFTMPNIPAWYVSLVKPSFNPPNWLFAPVWTALFALMGISLYLIWTKSKGRRPFYAFTVQLLLNVAWSILFFGLKSPSAGFVCIVALWLSIAACIIMFWKISRTASMLFVPYIAWVSFASLLNYMIWVLNP